MQNEAVQLNMAASFVCDCISEHLHVAVRFKRSLLTQTFDHA